MKQIDVAPEETIKFIDDSKLPLITNPFKEEWDHYEHSHKKTQITFVDNGLLKVNIDNQIYLITSGFLILIPPNFNHSAETQKNSQLLTVFTETQLMIKPDCIMATPFLKSLLVKLDNTFPNEHLSKQLVNSFSEILKHEIKDISSETNYKMLVPKNKKLVSIISYIDAHLSEKLSLSDISSRFFISDRHLSRLFKNETGLSFSDWIQKYKFLISVNRLSVAKSTTVVAKELGYDSDSSFIKMFKKFANGKTPSNFF